MNLLSLINSSGYMTINRDLAHKLGLDTAVLFCELVRQYIYWNDLGEIVSFDGVDGYFFATVDDMKKWTTLGEKEQAASIKVLKEYNLIEQVVKGLPAKRYFRLNIENIYTLFGVKKENLVPAKGRNWILQNGGTRPYRCNEYKLNESVLTDTHRSSAKLGDGTSPEAANAACVCVSDFSSSCPSLKNNPDPAQQCHQNMPNSPQIQRSLQKGVKTASEQDRSTTVKLKAKSKKPKDDKLGFGYEGLVKLTQKQHEDLIKHMSAAERDKWIEDLSHEIGAQGEARFNKKYSSHYHVILKWRRYRQDRTPVLHDGKDINKIAPHRRGSKLVTPGDYDDDNYRRQRL